jgi:LysM repeat protein
MNETARNERNAQRLTECFGPSAEAMRRVLTRMEAQGFRPRIQHAWRSIPEQLELFQQGFTKTKFGFHNVTGANGAKESLACDVLDDDHPLGPPSRYSVALAIAARAEGMMTGILWDLPAAVAAGTEAAVTSGNIEAPVKIGFDPTHVQPVGLTTKDARAGGRPSFNGSGPQPRSMRGRTPTTPPSPAPTTAEKFHVVVRGETLSGIARQHGITLARILELNPHKLANPNLILVGEKIRVA